MNFIREFNTYTKAAEFAKKTYGTVVPQYDWDNKSRTIVKKWIVKY